MRLAVASGCLAGILSAGCSDDPPLTPPTGPITATVTHYDYQLDLDSRAAAVDITLAVDVGGDCVTLPVRADALDRTTVTIDGLAATATVTAGNLTACGTGWAAGTALVLHADMTVPLETLADSQVGFSLTTDRRSNPFWFLISWVGGCDRFGPCDNRPDTFATYRFTVTHPDGVQVLCPGDITAPTATTSVCDFTHPGGPTYSTFGLVAASGWTATDGGDWDGVHATIYDTGSPIPDRIDAAYHGGFMAMMSSNFGPYPYGDDLRVITAPTYWAGFEHPGNIVLDDGLASGVNGSTYSVTHTLNHELAHQWAGDQTTLASTYDFVWKEAMAEYLAFVYEDETAPATGLVTARSWRSNSNGAAYFPVPAEAPALFDYYGDVYGPGPMVLFRQLEVMTSRDDVMAALAMVLGTPRTLSVPQVQAALEASTGLDLAAYFDSWVFGSGAPVWPRVSSTWANDLVGNGGSLSIVHTNATTSAGPCTFQVALDGAGVDERTLVNVDLAAGPSQAFTITDPGFAVTAVVLDPGAQCLVYPATAPVAKRHGPGFSPWRSRTTQTLR